MIKSIRMRWAEYVACMEERRGAYRVLMEKRERKRLFRRPRPRWEYNIKMVLWEVGWGQWTGLIWLRIGTEGGHL